MGFFGILLLVFFIAICLLLVFLVIIQDEDSDSIGGIFAGGSGSAFGSRSSNVVIRITYVLGALFFVTAFGLAVINKSPSGNIAAAQTQTSQQTSTTLWWNSQPNGTTQTSTPTSSGSAPSTTVTTVK
jgi:preprotein translocase subunit SecG